MTLTVDEAAKLVGLCDTLTPRPHRHTQLAPAGRLRKGDLVFVLGYEWTNDDAFHRLTDVKDLVGLIVLTDDTGEQTWLIDIWPCEVIRKRYVHG